MLRIGDLELDETSLEARYAGHRIQFTTKPFELLERLARDAGRVVKRDRLLEELWPAQVVSDAALGSAVRQVRRSLRALGAGDVIRIEVVRGRGYRLAVPDTHPTREVEARDEPIVPEPRESSPLVGRDAELSRLTTALADTLAGSARTVVLTGPAGIGKTRLVTELGTVASARGADVFWGQCQAGESPPLWPWAEMMRGLVRAREADDLRALLRTAAPDLAPILPSVRGLFEGEVIAPRPADPELARLSLLDSFIDAFERAAEHKPCVLVVDDAQWCDSSSLLLSRSLAQRQSRVGLLLIILHRDDELDPDHPTADELGALAQAPGVERLSLAPLSDERSKALLRTLGAERSADARLEELCRIAGGNPFFLRELYRHLAEEDDIGPLPRQVGRLILRRLEQRSPAARDVISYASVLGMDLSADLVRSLVASGEAPACDVDGALGELVRAGWLEPPSSAEDTYRFAHAITQRAVYDQIPAFRRARLHGVVARFLEASFEGDVPAEQAASLAEHFDLARDEQGTARAFAYRVLAGQDADRRLCFDEAARHFARAVDLFDVAHPPSDSAAAVSRDQERCELLIALAESAHKAGDEAIAAEAWEKALPIARRLDQPDALARLAVQAHFVLWEDDRMRELHEEVIGRLGTDDTPLRAVTLASLAARLRATPGTRERRKTLMADALAITEKVDDPTARSYVLDAFLCAMGHADLLPERLQRAGEMLDLATTEKNVWTTAQARAHRYAILLRMGRATEALDEVRALREIADRHRSPRIQWLSSGASFAAAFLDGRLSEAEEHCLLVGELAARHRNPTGEIALATQLATLRREQGRLQDALPLVEAFASKRPELAWSLEMARAHCGDRVSLRRLLASIATEDGAMLRHPSDDLRVVGLCWLADACAALGDAFHVDVIQRELAPFADTWAIGGTGFYAYGSVRRLLGNLELLQGHTARAIEEQTRSLEAHDQPGASLPHCWSRFDLARALRARARPEDLDRADRLLDETHAEASRRELPELCRHIESFRADAA